jgi:hypothetical protein
VLHSWRIKANNNNIFVFKDLRGFGVRRRKRSNQMSRFPKTPRFPDCPRYKTASTGGRSTGVVRRQDHVARRPDRRRQCSNPSGRSSTPSDFIGSTTICRRCRAVNETAGCAFTRVPARGSPTSLKARYDPLPRTCLFICRFVRFGGQAPYGRLATPSSAPWARYQGQ